MVRKRSNTKYKNNIKSNIVQMKTFFEITRLKTIIKRKLLWCSDL